MIDAENRLGSAMGIPPEIVEGLVKEYGSINAASRAIGMPQATLHNIIKGQPNSRLDTLEMIARVLKMPLWKLVRRMEQGQGEGK